MATINQFEDIVAWQKAVELARLVYKNTKQINDRDFCSQIQRAAVSVSNNIAEGFERRSNKEFKYFLFVAKGSAGETRSMLRLAVKLNLLKPNEIEESIAISIETSKLISGLIQKL